MGRGTRRFHGDHSPPGCGPVNLSALGHRRVGPALYSLKRHHRVNGLSLSISHVYGLVRRMRRDSHSSYCTMAEEGRVNKEACWPQMMVL